MGCGLGALLRLIALKGVELFDRCVIAKSVRSPR